MQTYYTVCEARSSNRETDSYGIAGISTRNPTTNFVPIPTILAKMRFVQREGDFSISSFLWLPWPACQRTLRIVEMLGGKRKGVERNPRYARIPGRGTIYTAEIEGDGASLLAAI